MIEIANETQYAATLEVIARLNEMMAGWEPLPPGIDPGIAQSHRDKVTAIVEELEADLRVYEGDAVGGAKIELICRQLIARGDELSRVAATHMLAMLYTLTHGNDEQPKP